MKRVIVLSGGLLAVLVIPTLAHAEGGIIGKMRGVLKQVNESDSEKQSDAGKQVESYEVKADDIPEEAAETAEPQGEQPEEANQQSAKAGHSFEEGIEAHIKAMDQEFAKFRDGRSPDEPFIADPEGPLIPTASSTDEHGNTITASRTENGVWITEVTGPDGTPLSTTKRQERPDGEERTETVDHRTGAVSRVETGVESGQRIKKASFERAPDGTKTLTAYENGKQSGSRTTHPNGDVTKTVFDSEGKPQYGKTTDSQGHELATFARKDFDDGDSATRETDTRRNTTTFTSRYADGGMSQEIEDSKTGEVLSGVRVGPDGSLAGYEPGKYADDAFKKAGVVATNRTTSSRDWKQDTESSMQIRRPQEELDRQLLSQMKGGQPVTGSDLITSSRSTDQMRSFERKGSNQPEDWEDTERQQGDSEIRQLDPAGEYQVQPVGNPVGAEGEGETPSEAWANALHEAGNSVNVHIESEMIDQTRGDEEHVRSDATHTSVAVFKDVLVEHVGRTEDGGYAVKITARPGLTTKR
jgi:hypothetical protein